MLSGISWEDNHNTPRPDRTTTVTFDSSVSLLRTFSHNSELATDKGAQPCRSITSLMASKTVEPDHNFIARKGKRRRRRDVSLMEEYLLLKRVLSPNKSVRH